MSRFPNLDEPGWLLARYREGMTGADIARHVGCSPVTVSRARRRHGLRFAAVAPGETTTGEMLATPTIGRWVRSGGPLRQSLLRSFDQCPQAAVWSTERRPDDHSGPSALGSALHMVAAEILATLRRTGETQMPSQEAIEVMYEVVARPECPHLPDDRLGDLRILVLQFCQLTWRPERIMSLEQRFTVEVPCPDGQTRTLTGAPDVVAADPPNGCVIVDYKTGWAVPPTPRDGDWSRDNGRPYLSERGVFQLDTYGYMALKALPAVERCTLREVHLRPGETREATLHRHEMEHVERRLGVLLQRLDHALERGAGEPRAGSWCSHCPRPSQCPIAAEERGDGAVTSLLDAVEVGARWAVDKARYEQARKPLKAFVEETGAEIPVGDSWIGWRFDEKGKRAFGIHNRPSADLAEAA